MAVLGGLGLIVDVACCQNSSLLQSYGGGKKRIVSVDGEGVLELGGGHHGQMLVRLGVEIL